MTTPTTGITLSSIQTEFGGANPISMSEYVQGGAYVPSGQATSATDGAAIPTSASGIRMGMFRGISKTSPVVQSWSTRASWINSGTTGSRSAQFKLNSDGTSTRSNGTATNTQVAGPNWYTGAPVTGIGSNYWVKATVTIAPSPGTMNGTYGTWIQLTSSVSWSCTNSGGANTEATGTVSYSIAASAGGAVIGSGTVDFDAGYAA